MTATVPPREAALPSLPAVYRSRVSVELKEFFRQRESVVFTLMFPVILLVVFGAVLNYEIGGGVSFTQYFMAGVIALSVVVAAYSSEVWVAALWSVPAGQREAARALGLNRRQVFRLVELPQLARVALPGLGNIWTVLLKDTSLISTLAVTDLLRAASEASKTTTRPLLFYSAAAAIYLAISIASGLAQDALERRANRGLA